MTSQQAAKILEDYLGSIKDLRPRAIVQSTDDLPYPSSKIKYAHFVHTENLIDQNKFTKEVASMLMESYGIIDSFFVEDSDAVNTEYREFIAGLKRGIITNFKLPNPFGESKEVLDFINFFEEYLFKSGKKPLFRGDPDPKPSFIWDAVMDKVRKEKDVATYIKIVNTRLTRAIHLDNEKSGRELVFV